ncbi:MAG TPA: type II secretion system protein GspL [Steroidobacteraceae bacterium]|nr:type II secretion system protein GspL [Steroidobacteraceae bacterium]
MPHTILLRLPSSPEQETEWLSIDAAGIPTARQRGPLSLAAAVARNARLIALAPASEIMLAQPELPPGSGAKIARAVPFALEEQLTEDIDQLSFALGRRRADGRTPVAVVARALLQSWLDELSGAGLEPTAIYPDVALMPQNPSQTVLWLEHARLAVRRPGALPFAVELTPLAEALVVAGVIPDPLAESADADSARGSALLYLTREDWVRVKEEFEPLARHFESLKVQLLADGPLPWLARELASTDAVNLLQGEYARATDYGERFRRWRTAALLGGALFATHIGAEALEMHRANREIRELDAQIGAVFSQAMPSEPVREPRAQMQSRLDRIRRSGPGPAYFLHTLQTLSGALAAVPTTRIDALSYHEQSLELKVTARGLNELSQLAQLMGKQGLTAEIQSSMPLAGGVEARLRVQSATPRTHR